MGYLVRIPTYTLLIIASSLAYYVFAGIRGFGMIYFTQHYGISRSTLGWLIVRSGSPAIVGGRGERPHFGMVAATWMGDDPHHRCRALRCSWRLSCCCGAAIWVTNVWFGVALFIPGAVRPYRRQSADRRGEARHRRCRELWGRGRSWPDGAARLARRRRAAGRRGGVRLARRRLLSRPPVGAAPDADPAPYRQPARDPASRTYPRDVATARASIEELESRRG